MYKLSLINPYDTQVQYKTLSSLMPQSGGIVDLKLKVQSNNPYQLILTMNAQCPFWNELKNDRTLGVRFTTKYIDLAFLQYDRKQNLEGKQTFTFISSCHKLNRVRPNNLNIIYKGSLASFLGSLSSDFIFDFISSDQEITLDTGITNSLTLITEAMQKAKGYSWVEAGLVDVGNNVFKTRIAIGDFGQDLEGYYQSTGDKAFTPLFCEKRALLDDWEDDNTANLNYLNENDSGDTFKYLLPVGNSGSGAGSNSTNLVLTNPTASYINGQFPLVALTNPTNGKVEYWIQNPFYTSYLDTFEVQSFTGTNNSEQGETLTTEQTEASLYAEAVAYIKRKSLIRQITMNAISKRVCLPNTLCYVQYNEKIKLLDNEVLNPYSVKEVFCMDDMEFDLTKISL
jgi:hypothetical protein